MKILVANIGSTSFKFRLFEIDSGAEREVASGGADRIGGDGSVLKLVFGDGLSASQPCRFDDHGQAITFILDELTRVKALKSKSDLDAVAFKAVMGGDCEPVTLVDEKLLERMEYFIPVAPAHNPPYIAAMRMFAKTLQGVPLVAAFEPGFHQTNPDRRRHYAVPLAWANEYGVKRYGFHGASHRYIATRIGELMPEAKRVISCHLGGSSSICAIRDGKSVATSMGLSPQSGLPQSNRCGDFDAFAFAMLKGKAGLDAEAVLAALGGGSGLAALSETSGDMRDIRKAAEAGSEKARLALDIFITAIRDYVGAYLAELGGTDALVFTGGMGIHNPWLRSAVCENLAFAGIALDPAANDQGGAESRIEAENSQTAVWVIETNEELIVARQAAELLGERNN